MTHPTIHFYFQPSFISTNETLTKAKDLVVEVEVTDSIIKTIEAIRYAGVVQHEVRIWVPSKCYEDPLLMDSLKHRTAMTIDALGDSSDTLVQPDLYTSLVLKKAPDSSLVQVFFESKMFKGAFSKVVNMDSFLDCFQAALTGHAFTDEANLSALDGLIINHDNPEPSDLQDFEIDVVRVACSKPRTFKIRARTLEDAENTALDMAGNYEYSESEANYEIV